MRRNPRRTGSEQAGSRLHETNVSSSISEYMGMCVLSLFPGRFHFGFYSSLGLRREKELTGQNPLSVLEPSALILNLGFACQHFF
jgi:hypothetical protein